MTTRTVSTTPTSGGLVEPQTAKYVEERLKEANVNSMCRAEITAFVREVEKQDSKTLEWMWSNGKRLERLRTERKYRPSANGEGRVDPLELCSQISGYSISRLHAMARLFRVFSSDEAKTRLLSYRTVRGKPLTWHHMELLIPFVVDEASTGTYEKWLNETLTNDWSPDDLGKAIAADKKQQGEKPHAGGRPTAIPLHFEGRIGRLISQTGTIRKNVPEIYESAEYSFLETLQGMAQADVAKKAKHYEALVHELDSNLQATHEFAERQMDIVLPAVLQYIQKCLAGHNQDSETQEPLK